MGLVTVPETTPVSVTDLATALVTVPMAELVTVSVVEQVTDLATALVTVSVAEQVAVPVSGLTETGPTVGSTEE